MPTEIIRTVKGSKYRVLVYWDEKQKKQRQKSLGRVSDSPHADSSAQQKDALKLPDLTAVEETEAEKNIFNRGYEKGLDDAPSENEGKINDLEKQHAEAITRAKDEEYKSGHEAGRKYWYNLGQKETEQKYSTMYQTQVHALESKYYELVNNLHLKYQEKEKQFEQDKAKARSMVEEAKKYFSDSEKLLAEAKRLLDENIIMHGIAEHAKTSFPIKLMKVVK